MKPILLAGIIKVYSSRAIHQLIRIMPATPQLGSRVLVLNFRWPYQANVIKLFDTISINIVINPLFILKFSNKKGA